MNMRAQELQHFPTGTEDSQNVASFIQALTHPQRIESYTVEEFGALNERLNVTTEVWYVEVQEKLTLVRSPQSAVVAKVAIEYLPNDTELQEAVVQRIQVDRSFSFDPRALFELFEKKGIRLTAQRPLEFSLVDQSVVREPFKPFTVAVELQ